MRLLHKLGLSALISFICMLALASSMSGCRPPDGNPGLHRDSVDPQVAAGFAAARVALALADSAEAAYLDSLAHPTAEQLEASSKRVAILTAVRDSLERVRQHLAGEIKPDLRQALEDLQLVVVSAQNAGVKLPPEVAGSLRLLQEALR